MSDGELAAKRERLLALADAAGFDGVLLTQPANVAWYTGGGRVHLIADLVHAVAQVLVQRDGDVVFTDEIEARRLHDEELGVLEAELRVRPWSQPAEPPSDVPTDVDEAATIVRRARETLTVEEVERYRRLGADAAAVLTDVVHLLSPGSTEWQAAGAMTGALMERGMDAVAFFVAGEERLPLYRHPLPTDARLGTRAMLVACARRGGLIACLSRLVAFSPLSDGEHDRYRRLLDVEAAFLDATRVGRSLGEVFDDGIAAYARHGFDGDEWRRHHQGGPTGYLARDEVATSASTALVAERQVFAWNPSAPGVKVEDTCLVGSAGVEEILTLDARWPVVEVGGRARPAILER